jgi:hypothetical protein
MPVEIAPGAALPVGFVPGFGIPVHDWIGMDYTGALLTTVTYKQGGVSGTVVAVLTMSYDGAGNLISVSASI